MTVDYRIRNILVAAALAAAAVLLTIVYVTSARSQDEAAKESVTVYVASKNHGVGASGASIAGAMTETTVAREDVVADAVTKPADIRNLYLVQPVFEGEQLTLKRFAQAKEQGVRAQLVGKQRAMQVAGDVNQVLSGTLVPGDRVDVVANLRNPANQTEVKTTTVLRNVKVLQTEDGKDVASLDKPEDQNEHAVLLAVTDEQSERLYYAMQNGDWALQLRPVSKPKDSVRTVVTYATAVNGGRK